MSHSIFKIKSYAFQCTADKENHEPIIYTYDITDDPMGARLNCINDMLEVRKSFINNGTAYDFVDRMRFYLTYDVLISDAGDFKLHLLNGIKDCDTIMNKLAIEFVMLMESGTHIDDDEVIVGVFDDGREHEMIGNRFNDIIYFYDYPKDV